MSFHQEALSIIATIEILSLTVNNFWIALAWIPYFPPNSLSQCRNQDKGSRRLLGQRIAIVVAWFWVQTISLVISTLIVHRPFSSRFRQLHPADAKRVLLREFVFVGAFYYRSCYCIFRFHIYNSKNVAKATFSLLCRGDL